MKNMGKISFHINMLIDTAIRETKKGVNLFDLPKEEALRQLRNLKIDGKAYLTGSNCDNQDELGQCKGHPVEEKDEILS